MRAALLTELPAEELVLADVPAPGALAADELLLAVAACGICGTDVHILSGESYRPELPFTLGHEPVGTVVAAGDAAQAWVGARVVPSLFTGCGGCAACATGDERLCPRLRSIIGVLGAPGAFAESCVLRAAQAVEVPAVLSDHDAAVLVDAGATAVNAARRALAGGGPATRRAVVVGGGPVGMLTAEVVRHVSGSAPTVVERSGPRRAAVAAVGLPVTASLDEAAADGPPDLILECSGDPAVMPWALRVLAPRGRLVLAGYATVAELDFAPVAQKELTIGGVRSGSPDDLAEALRLAASRAIALPPVDVWPLADINAAFGALRRGEVSGKALIAVNTGSGADPERGMK
jgi:2-desacetyl-2-hydroxyethyl bacteriochlorophyllide A dehydrogenase